MPNYTPPDDRAQLYARFKRHNDAVKELTPEVRKAAAEELKAGAGVGELAKLTGLTPEVFRRIAREAGVERRRPPTVVAAKDAHAAKEEGDG
jgi:hypothetical protein